MNSTKIRLICFPPAGVGTRIFRPWIDKLPNIEVIAITLPGKDYRFKESCPDTLELLADQIYNEIFDLCKPPYYMLGYSMGGVLGYEVILRLMQNKNNLPLAFFTLASSPPNKAIDIKDRIHKLESSMFRKEISDLGGLPAEILHNEELMSLFEPVIRHDFKLCENYRGKATLPLNVNIHCYAAELDNLVNTETLKYWQPLTTKNFFLSTIKNTQHILSQKDLDKLFVEIVEVCTINPSYKQHEQNPYAQYN